MITGLRLVGRDLGRRYPGVVSIGRNAATFVSGEWVEVLLRAIYALAISRFLGPSDYGWWSYGFAVSAICITFAGMGTDMLLPKRIGQQGRGALAFMETSFTVRLVMLLVLGLVLGSYAMLGVDAASDDGGAVEQAVLLLLIPSIVFRGLSNWLRVASIGFEQARLSVRPMVIVRTTEVIIGLGLLFSGTGLFTLLALHATSWLLETALILPRIRRLAPLGLAIRAEEVREVVRDGAAIGLASALGFLLFGLPVVLLKSIIGEIELVGQFGLAMQLAMFAVMALLGVSAAAQAVLSRAVARDDRRAQLFGHLFMLGCLFLILPAWLGGSWLGVSVVTFLLGKQYEVAGALLPVCFVLAITVTMANGYWQTLVLRGRILLAGLANGAAVATMVASAAPLLAQYDVAGVAYAAIIGGIVRTGLMAAFVTAASRVQKLT